MLSILSYTERERLAYAAGAPDAPLLAELAEHEARAENTSDEALESLQTEIGTAGADGTHLAAKIEKTLTA